MKLKTTIALLFLTLAGIAGAQTPSGLLSGPVTYTLAAPEVVHYVVGPTYHGLVASDGTGNCYYWAVWQLDTGGCQTSFHGGAPGEYGGLYCSGSTSSDTAGIYTLSCTAGWDGTAITVQDGIDVPIPTQYTINVTITHHSVRVWIPPHYKTPGQWQIWQSVDSMVVTVTPIV